MPSSKFPQVASASCFTYEAGEVVHLLLEVLVVGTGVVCSQKGLEAPAGGASDSLAYTITTTLDKA